MLLFILLKKYLLQILILKHFIITVSNYSLKKKNNINYLKKKVTPVDEEIILNLNECEV